MPTVTVIPAIEAWIGLCLPLRSLTWLVARRGVIVAVGRDAGPTLERGTMIGHELTLTETNTRGWTWVCECGEIGTVQPLYGEYNGETLRRREKVAMAHDDCRAEHRLHLVEMEHQISEQSMRSLASSAAYVQKVAPTIRQVGRWGRG